MSEAECLTMGHRAWRLGVCLVLFSSHKGLEGIALYCTCTELLSFLLLTTYNANMLRWIGAHYEGVFWTVLFLKGNHSFCSIRGGGEMNICKYVLVFKNAIASEHPWQTYIQLERHKTDLEKKSVLFCWIQVATVPRFWENQDHWRTNNVSFHSRSNYAPTCWSGRKHMAPNWWHFYSCLSSCD